MRRAWAVLLISALVDGSIAAITGVMTILTAPLLSKDGAIVPWSTGLLVVPILGGALIFAKTIQSAMAQTSTQIAELRGRPVITTTTLPGQSGEIPEIITKTPDRTVFEKHLARRHDDPPLWPPPPLPPAPPPAAPLPPLVASPEQARAAWNEEIKRQVSEYLKQREAEDYVKQREAERGDSPLT
jgi:hypothetical protein